MAKLAGLELKGKPVTLESLDDTWLLDQANGGAGATSKTKARRGLKKQKNQPAADDTRTPQERLADQVTPLWRLSYEQQLQEKTNVARDVLLGVGKQLQDLASNPSISIVQRAHLGWVSQSQTENDGLPCPMYNIVPSPITTHYRTKCEFSFGIDPSGKRTVGFLLGLVKDGFTAVLDASDCLHVSKAALSIRDAMQEYIDDHEWGPYDRIDKVGVWRLLVVKTFWSGESGFSRGWALSMPKLISMIACLQIKWLFKSILARYPRTNPRREGQAPELYRD